MDDRIHPYVQTILDRLRALSGSPAGRRAMVLSGVGVALLLALLLAGLLGASPEEESARLELKGRDLFEAIMERQPGLRQSSRIAAAAEPGSGANLMVLPAAVWQELEVDERNSLGAWLNTLGRRWEIRVGILSEDGARVLDHRPVITSRAWNQQVK